MNEPLILDGKKVAEELYSTIPNMNGRELAIITIGDDAASKVYVRNKIKACEKVGLKGINYRFDPPKSMEDDHKIAAKIQELNDDKNVYGIIVQLPYPKFVQKFEELILPYKDVDGICEFNMVRTLTGREPLHYPATPKGIITLLDYYNIPIEGKNVVVIGRSNIVGKPIAAMMTARNASVTLCHSKTPKEELQSFCQNADIIISAVGKAKFINQDFIRYNKFQGYEEGFELCTNYPVIIDVGINRDENGKLCGDVDYYKVLPYVSAITPVPGGIGPMTVLSLILNCCDL